MRLSEGLCTAAWKTFIPFVALSMVIGTCAVYVNGYNGPPIRSDGVGYYAYLPAVFIYKDLTMEKLARKVFQGSIPTWTGIARYPGTGRYLDKYTIGEAVMILPFFLVADLLAKPSGYPRDGFSWPYQAVGATAGMVYVIIGLCLLRTVLRCSFSPGVALAVLATIVYGTNLFHYATYDSLFSHAFSFFLFAALVYLTPRWYGDPSVRRTLALGLTCGLVLLVRLANAPVLVWVPLWGLFGRADVRRRIRFIADHKLAIATVLASSVLALLPQLFVWKYITGRWIVFPYQGEGFNFGSPEILNVLFSVRKGLFFWSPIVAFSVIGLFELARYLPGAVVPLLAFLPLNLYIIATWEQWHFGGSFGHRAFVESLALLALPTGAFYASLKTRTARVLVAGTALCLIAVSMIQMLQYWKNIIDMDGTTWEYYKSIFLRLSP